MISAWLRRFAAFASLPVLATIGPLLALPLIARNVDAQDWAALTVGQSLGLLASIVVGLGWQVVGASLVAQSSTTDRRRVYAESLSSRGAAAVVLVPLVGVVGAMFAPGQGRNLTCAVMAMSAALSGLSIVWFCVGKSAPREIAVFDIAPRTIGLLLGALGVVLTGDAILYPVLTALAVVAGLLVYSWRQLGNDGWAQLAATSPVRLLRDQFKLALIETSAASFTLGLGFLASFSLTVSELAGLGSGERIAQAMIQAVAALSNTVHPWVAVAAGLGFRRRVIRAGAAQILLGVILLVGLGVGGPPVSAILFGPRLAAPPAVCWGLGLYLLFVSLQTVVCRHILVTRRQTRYVVRANVAAAAFGVPLVLVGASVGGAPGAVAGMAAGELLIFLFAAPAAVRSLRVASRPAH